MDAHRVYSMLTDRNTGIICDQRIAMNGFYISQDYPEQLWRIRFKDLESGKTWCSWPTTPPCPHWPLPHCTKAAGKSSCSQTASAHQAFHRQQGKCDENANLVRCRCLRADCHYQKGASTWCLSLFFATDFIGVCFWESPAISSLRRQWAAPKSNGFL